MTVTKTTHSLTNEEFKRMYRCIDDESLREAFRIDFSINVEQKEWELENYDSLRPPKPIDEWAHFAVFANVAEEDPELAVRLFEAYNENFDSEAVDTDYIREVAEKIHG